MTLLAPSHRRPINPGAVLREDFLETLDMTQGQVAQALGVDRTSISELINGHRSVTTEMALRLSRAFGTSPQYWLNLQLAVDLFDTINSPVGREIARLEVLVPGKQRKAAATATRTRT